MDDFLSGPNDFYIHFISTDESVFKQDDGYVYMLRKPLDLAGEWEVGVSQVILKPPAYDLNNFINYVSPDNPDDKTFKSMLNLKMEDFPKNPKDLINQINASVPESLKKEFSLAIDEENHAVLNIKNTQVKINSTYLNDVLGLKPETVYPNDFPTRVNKIRSSQKIKMISLCPVFFIETDLTVPELFGSYNRRILCTDIFSDDRKNFVSYKYENISYRVLLRSYISTIQITLKDIYDNYYQLQDPVIIKFHFRKSSIL